MSRLLIPLGASLLFSLAPLTTAPAQAHSLVGTWSVEFAAGMRMENGEQTPIMGKGTLTVVVAGDSLVATLTREASPDGQKRPPARMAARATGPKVVFEQRSEARLNANGEEMIREAITVWTLSAAGDTLEGSMKRTIVGLDLPDMGALPVKGSRVKS